MKWSFSQSIISLSLLVAVVLFVGIGIRFHDRTTRSEPIMSVSDSQAEATQSGQITPEAASITVDRLAATGQRGQSLVRTCVIAGSALLMIGVYGVARKKQHHFYSESFS